MKRLRNIAVRMRPPAPTDDDLDADYDAAFGAETVSPPRVDPQEKKPAPLASRADPGPQGAATETPDAPPLQSPQIWDLDQSADVDPGADMHPAPVPDPAPVKDPAPVPPVNPTEMPGRAGRRPRAPDRAKTRLLGFADPGVLLDPLNQAAAGASPRPAAARFTAGWLIVVEGPGRGIDFAVTSSVSTLGRDPDQSICLDFGDTAISRQAHASVVYDDEQNRFFLGQGGKSNIVRRNGQPVLATEELRDGDTIRIGKTTLLFKALCGADFTWADKPVTDAAADPVPHGGPDA